MPSQEEGGEYPVRETEEELSQPASLSESRDQIHRALLKTQGKIDLRNESGRPMKVKVVGQKKFQDKSS